MKKTQLFEYLKKQKPSLLIELLQSAYEELDTDQREDVFGNIIDEIPLSPVKGDQLLQDIQAFRSETLSGHYYSPFNINSKNYMHIPEETRIWFSKLGDFLNDSTRLTEQGDLSTAVECFTILYDLVEKMEAGEDIVFADEIGSWMIPGDEKLYIHAYLSAAAATSTPEEYASIAMPLIRRDSYSSFVHKTYASAVNLASEEQKEHLTEEVKKHKIKTKLR